MTTQTLERITPNGTDLPDLVHVVCLCSPDIALCGIDRSTDDWAPEGAETGCVVCADLEELPCPRCGE